ncbi:MAG: Ada metal-binding domain-containing protein, partial [Candidatus Humimicrobiaceae bacterium]
TTQASSTNTFVGSKNSDVFHVLGCRYVKNIKESNKVYFSSYDDAISKGYRPCKVCNPTP